MSADDFIEIIPHTRLSVATRLWADWLRSRGLQETHFREHEFEHEVGRAQVGSLASLRPRLLKKPRDRGREGLLQELRPCVHVFDSGITCPDFLPGEVARHEHLLEGRPRRPGRFRQRRDHPPIDLTRLLPF